MINRIAYLDQIRGLMILWMLVVHISLNYGITSFDMAVTSTTAFTLMSFFMTPFYVFSGYLFSNQRNIYEFTINKVRKLLIPYVVFTLFGIGIYEAYSLVEEGTVHKQFLFSFVPTAAFTTNTPCWFFVSLFLVSEIYYVLYDKLGGGIFETGYIDLLDTCIPDV